MKRLVMFFGAFAIGGGLVVSCAAPVPCDGYWRDDARYQLGCDLGPNRARRD